MTSTGDGRQRPVRRADARTGHARRAWGATILVVVVLGLAGVAIASTLPGTPEASPPAVSPTRTATPTPAPTPTPTPTLVPVCERPGVAEALATGDNDAAIIAMGGGTAVRDAVAAGGAPCIDLGDPERPWVVVNKLRPIEPRDHWPATLGPIDGVASLSGSWLRTDAGTALSALAADLRADGAGDIALESAFRSFASQQRTYQSHVSSKGQEGADRASARPGFSEHQTGLAVDVVACDGGCGTLDGLAATPQGAWIAANAWRHGFIVRYEACCTEITGYAPEPWHLRYIGVPLAQAYHEGAFGSLEQFWGLPAAPDYAG